MFLLLLVHGKVSKVGDHVFQKLGLTLNAKGMAADIGQCNMPHGKGIVAERK